MAGVRGHRRIAARYRAPRWLAHLVAAQAIPAASRCRRPAVASIISALRPGGWMLAEDPDFVTPYASETDVVTRVVTQRCATRNRQRRHGQPGVCAFSLTSRITQRDGTTGRDAPGSRTLLYPATRDRAGRLHRDVHGRPAACRNPGLLDDSGLASASRPRIARGPQAPGRQPGHPGARSSSPAASGCPGRAPVHPLRRDPRSAPPPGGRSPCGRHDGRGRQRTTAIQEDLAPS